MSQPSMTAEGVKRLLIGYCLVEIILWVTPYNKITKLSMVNLQIFFPPLM